jgi:hypothetical protein
VQEGVGGSSSHSIPIRHRRCRLRDAKVSFRIVLDHAGHIAEHDGTRFGFLGVSVDGALLQHVREDDQFVCAELRVLGPCQVEARNVHGSPDERSVLSPALNLVGCAEDRDGNEGYCWPEMLGHGSVQDEGVTV